MLTCSCPEWDMDAEPGSWWYDIPDNFSVFNATRRKRCSSCNELINIGSECLEFERERIPFTETEQRISGDEIRIAPLFMCEKCGEIYLNLIAAGYCLDITVSMQRYLDEYHEFTGFKKGVGNEI